MRIAIIAAMSLNRVIGKNNQIPWHLSDDLKRVKALTTGNAIIMGRKTYESIGKALPNRINIVLTSQVDFQAPGCVVVHSLKEALNACQQKDTFIFGGSSLYKLTLDIASHMHLTVIQTCIEGDTFFPPWDPKDWRVIQKTQHSTPEWDYEFVDLERCPQK
jgi:dihydrofolate reductase